MGVKVIMTWRRGDLCPGKYVAVARGCPSLNVDAAHNGIGVAVEFICKLVEWRCRARLPCHHSFDVTKIKKFKNWKSKWVRDHKNKFHRWSNNKRAAVAMVKTFMEEDRITPVFWIYRLKKMRAFVEWSMANHGARLYDWRSLRQWVCFFAGEYHS